MSGFVDLHAHVVYGMDDGAQTREEMLAMLDAAVSDGVGMLCCTPHVNPGLTEFREKEFRERLFEAQAYCDAKNYPLTLYSGAEILYTPALLNYIENDNLPSYDGSRVILMEFVPDVTFREMEEALRAVDKYDYIPVIAHMERYSCMAMGGAYRLKEKYRIYYQINCNTVLKSRGFLADKRLEHWLKDKLIDAVSTDSHNTDSRRTRMTEAHNALVKRVGKKYADSLCSFSF